MRTRQQGEEIREKYGPAFVTALMQKAFPWLVGFMVSQVALMCVAANAA
jgi:hypothetical protein